MPGRFESSIGVVAAALSFIGLGCAVFGPATYSYGTNRLAAGTLTVLWTSALALLAGGLLTLPGSTTAIVPSALHTATPDSVGIGIYLLLPALVAVAEALGLTAIHPAPRTPAQLGPR